MLMIFQRVKPLLYLFMLLLTLSSCNSAKNTDISVEGTPAIAATNEVESPSSPDGDVKEDGVTPAAETSVENPEGSDIQDQTNVPPDRTPFHIWIASDIGSLTDNAHGNILQSQIQQFADAHPDLDVDWQTKAVDGEGGIVSYLLQGQDIAPSILPDVVLLPADYLATSAADCILQPLSGSLAETITAQAYDSALTLAQVNGVLYGSPVRLTDATHLIYNSEVITNSLPLNWQDLLLVNGAKLVLPVGGSYGSKLVLEMYGGVGGGLTNEAGETALDGNALTRTLGNFATARQLEVIDPEFSQISTPADSWRILEEGQANIAYVSAETYMSKKLADSKYRFSTVPGTSGTLVGGWVWAMPTNDSGNYAVAADFITWISVPANSGAWTAAAQWLPAQPAAFDSWPASDYTTFLQSDLARSKPYPTAIDVTLRQQLIQAVVQVVSGEQAAINAAQQIIDFLAPK